jgi:hypothetical protein
MLQLLGGFGRLLGSRHIPRRRPRSIQAGVELLEGRQVLSTLSTVSAISWQSGGQNHSAVYVIGSNDSVFVNVDATGYRGLGGYVKEISAGLDASGNPEVFGIGTDNAAWVNRGAGWTSLGGYVTEISATRNNTVYGIGTDNAAWVNRGAGWTSLGGYVKEISAGLDASGNPEVFGIGLNDGVWVNRGAGWTSLGGYVREIAAPNLNVGLPGNVVYAVGIGHGGLLYRSGSITSLGGYIL